MRPSLPLYIWTWSQSYCITSMANKRPKASLTAEKQFAVKYPDLDTQNPSQGKEQKGFSEIRIQRLSSLRIGTPASAVLGPSKAAERLKQATLSKEA